MKRMYWLAAFLLGWAFVLAQDTTLYLEPRAAYRPDQMVLLDVSNNVLDAVQVNFMIFRFNNPLEVFKKGRVSRWTRPEIPVSATKTLVARVSRFVKKDAREVNLGRLSAGLYEVQAVMGSKRGSSVLLISDLSLITKQSPQEIRLLTLNRFSGQKRSAKVFVFQGQNFREFKTDANGSLQLPIVAKNAVLVAQVGQNFAPVSSSWRFETAQKYVFTGQTDRTMYRPGDSIEFRGNFRADNSLIPIASRVVSVVLCDAERELGRLKLETNKYGSFSGRFNLRPTARVSSWDYRIIMNPEKNVDCAADWSSDNGILTDFAVREYIKPDFKISLKTPTVALQGTRVPLEISATYLFGGGLSNGRVKVVFSRQSTYTRDDPSYTDFGFEYPEDYSTYNAKTILDQITALDATGNLRLELPLEVNTSAFPVQYLVQVQIEDESRKTLSQFAEITAYPSTVRVALRPTRYFFNVGEPFEINVQTRDLTAKTTNNMVELQLVRQEYLKNTVLREGREVPVWNLKETPLEKRTIQTRNGSARTVFKPSLGGGYVVRARTKDANGRLSKAETFAWQLSNNDTWGWNVDYPRVTLNKSQYKVGETATALIFGVPIGVDAWLSLESDRIIQNRLVRTTQATLAYTFKVTAAMQPNVYFKISYIKDAQPIGTQYGEGTNIRVPKDNQRLQLKIISSKPRFAPSEIGQLELQATNQAGQAVQTELSLAVVDEGIYLLREDGTPNPFDIFHGDRPNVVGTNSSDDEDGEFGGGGDGDEEAGVDTADNNTGRIRKDFRDTALWVGLVETNSSGIAKLAVPYPDNLTTWRITARGQTILGLAGESKAQTLVTKDLIVRISKPEFLIRGDTTNLRGIVNNNLVQNTSGLFKFDLLGLTSISPLEGKLEVPAKARASFDTQITATALGTAKIQGAFTSSLGSDGLELPMLVKPRGFTATQTWAGDSNTPDKTFILPEDAQIKTAKLRLSLTPSLLSAVEPALERLIGYPFGCTEQTLSRFIPALLAAEIAPRADLPDLLEAGLQRLQTLRHEDGGWGFWSFDDSAMDMTASVVLSLARLSKQKISPELYATMLESGTKWLQNNLKNTTFSRGSRALAHRALSEANKPDLETMQAFALIPDLEPYHLAQLALAYHSLNRLELAKNLLERLKVLRIERDSTVQWQRPKNPYRWNYYWDDNPILVTATALEALGKLEPSSPLIPKTINGLLQARRGDWWVSTADTSAIISAALTLPKPSASSQEVKILLNGKVIAEQIVTATGTNLDLEPKFLTGENTLEITGNLAYGVRLEYTREPTRLSAESNGIGIKRSYKKLEKRWNETLKDWIYTTQPLIQNGIAQPVTVGDLIMVELEVSPESGLMRHVQIIEPIPAGFQAIPADDLNFGNSNNPIGQYQDWNYWYAARDIYNDRIEMFAQSLEPQAKLTVILRAQTAGTYTHLPSSAELMYDPEINGRSSAATLTVRE